MGRPYLSVPRPLATSEDTRSLIAHGAPLASGALKKCPDFKGDTFQAIADSQTLEDHEWINSSADAATGNTVRVGITSVAADRLGEVVFAELPEVEDYKPVSFDPDDSDSSPQPPWPRSSSTSTHSRALASGGCRR